MNTLIKSLVAIAIYLFGSTTIFGCSCFAIPVSDGFKSAGAVFSGKVISTGEYDSKNFKNWEIEVTKVWKGKVAKRIKLYSHISKNAMVPSCEPEFDKNENYIFFVGNRLNSTAFTTIPCNWTTVSTRWNQVLEEWDKENFWKSLDKGKSPLRNKNLKQSKKIQINLRQEKL